MRRSALALLTCLALGMTTIAFAESGDEPPPPPRKPPSAAYDACKDQAEGDDCEVSFHEHKIEGTCQPDHEDGRLFCRPDHPPPRPQR
jgi:hypothetical protein